MSLPLNLTLSLLDHLPDAIAVIDARREDFPVILANGPLEQLRQRARADLVRDGLAGLIGTAAAETGLAELKARFGRAEAFTIRAVIADAAADSAKIDVRFEPMRNEENVLTHYVSFHQLVTDPAAVEPAPVVRAPLQRDDRLTGLRHLEYFHELLRRDFAIAQRDGRPLALYVADIDALARYNDTFGRLAGDSVIRRVGRALSGGLRRASDLLARMDGGRFVALSSGLDLAQARRHGEALAARVRELHMHHPKSPVARVVTVSVGVAHLTPNPQSTPEQLLAAGRQALESARAAGRNRVSAEETIPG
jgi:diguanylate cyclase (GGDEF)-like protein